MSSNLFKLAFLFAGQGSQTVGMVGSLAGSCEACLKKFGSEQVDSPADGSRRTAMTCDECQATFQVADRALDFPLSEIMAEGPAQALSQTVVTQPALLTVSVAQAYRLLSRGIVPDALAGHSLGQYSALVVAGALGFESAVRLVAARGELMQRAMPEQGSAMAAVVGLDRQVIYVACERARSLGVVNVACHNSPGQTVISGVAAAVEAASAYCEEEGGAAVSLPISVASHCDLLASMTETFGKLLETTTIQQPKIPVIDNVTALPLEDADDVRQSLVVQLTKPVLFEESLRYLIDAGTQRFVQCGPGNSLLGMAKRVTPGLELRTFEEAVSKEMLAIR